MENKLRYSIVYAELRPEISERISVAIIIFSESSVDVKYSSTKLSVLKQLYSPEEYKMLSRVVRTIGKTVKSIEDVNYLSRYCNNMISVTRLQTIDIVPTANNKKWLYNNYIHS